MVGKKLQDIKTFNWVILFILGALSGVFMEVQFTLGVILGGLIIIANFSPFTPHHAQRFFGSGRDEGQKNGAGCKILF